MSPPAARQVEHWSQVPALRDHEIQVHLQPLHVADGLNAPVLAASLRSQAGAFLSAGLVHATGALPSLVVGAHGKPALLGGEPRFNLSHTRGWAALAIARGVDVGIDVEGPPLRRNALAIAQRYFDPAEARAVQREAEPGALFLRLWTHKEAVLKAAGTGLAYGLQRVRFDPSQPTPWDVAVDGPLSDRQWQVLDLSERLFATAGPVAAMRCVLAWADASPAVSLFMHEAGPELRFT